MPETSILCPICSKRVALSDPEAPFCSARCRLLDLGNWASGSYRIPTSSTETDSLAQDEADFDADREAGE